MAKYVWVTTERGTRRRMSTEKANAYVEEYGGQIEETNADEPTTVTVDETGEVSEGNNESGQDN